MSIKCLVIGDCHFSVSNLLDADAFIEKAETAVRRLKPDFIVCLGDQLDKHEQCHMDPYIRACTFLEKMASYAPTFLNVGNHDRRNNQDFQSPDHFFVGMKHCPNLTIVDTAIKTEVTSKKDPNVKGNFLFVPYVAPGRFYEALDSIDLHELGADTWRSPSIDAIFAHQEFKGVQLGPIKSVNGDLWDVTWPLVITGHIHDYQVLQPNLIYVGTPMQHAFSEAPNKAITLFDFNTQYCEDANITLEEVRTLDALVPEPYVKARYARIQLNLCTKRTTTITVAQVASFKPFPNE